ncbi:MAG: hypothetical protein AAGH57_07725 [Pseudomonadota bacterium]
MFDDPPIEPVPEPPAPSALVAQAPPTGNRIEDKTGDRTLPSQTRADGTLVIDLMPLAPAPQTCLEEAPDPFNPTIVVCGRTEPDPRLGTVLPSTQDILFGSAVPRARLKLSDNSEAQANTIKKSVGGFDADGAEVRWKLEF